MVIVIVQVNFFWGDLRHIKMQFELKNICTLKANPKCAECHSKYCILS